MHHISVRAHEYTDACCTGICGFTLGLATADVTKDPVVKDCVDEPGELVSIAALDKTELWRHSAWIKSQQRILGKTGIDISKQHL